MVSSLRERQPLRVLLMTGYRTEDVQRQVRESGYPLLRKPFRAAELIDTVRGLLT